MTPVIIMVPLNIFVIRWQILIINYLWNHLFNSPPLDNGANMPL